MDKKTVLLISALALFLGCAFASSVSRDFNTTTLETGSDLEVTLTVDVDSEDYYGIDESVPITWTLLDSGAGDYNQILRSIKWIYITDVPPGNPSPVDTSYQYVLTAPSQAETTTFAGVYMFEGMSQEIAIEGLTQVIVTPASCVTDSDCPGQICCTGFCVNAECDLNADCTDNNFATADTCESPGLCAAQCVFTPIVDCINNDNFCPVTCDENTDNDCVDTCNDEIVDPGETCDNCPQDFNCTSGTICCGIACVKPTCSSASDCDDSDDCTTDSCSSPSSCTSSCTHTVIPDCGGGGGGWTGGGGGGGGGGGARLIVLIQGSCIGQPISVEVKNQMSNPAKDATVKVVKGGTTIETKKTGETGKLSFTLEEEGEYSFYTIKNLYNADIQKVQVTDCVQPIVSLEPSIETGKDQTIMLIGGDGNMIQDFNVLLTYPDNTTALLSTNEGAIVIPIEVVGSYSVTVQAEGYQQTLDFEAKEPLQIVPNINPDARPAVGAVFGQETVDKPNYLIIWILSIAVISGLIIEVTKLKPFWFRIFMGVTYTALPIVVQYYGENIMVSFAVIAIQTTILTALWFKQWKARRVGMWMRGLEKKGKKAESPVKKPI